MPLPSDIPQQADGNFALLRTSYEEFARILREEGAREKMVDGKIFIWHARRRSEGGASGGPID
jgi:hypothetical protein